MLSVFRIAVLLVVLTECATDALVPHGADVGHDSTQASHNVESIVLNSAALSLPKLPCLNVNQSTITISGISSGAAFAVQMSVAYSSLIEGAAIFAGKPWQCERLTNPAWVGGETSSTCNVHPDQIRVDVLLKAAHAAEAANQIDPLSGLTKSRYFVYRGIDDPIYREVGTISALNITADFYAHFAGPAAVNRVIDVIPSGHGVPTLNYGVPCADTGSPYLNNCDLDGVGDALKWMLPGRDIVRNAEAVNLSRLVWFDQRPFFWGNGSSSGFGPTPGLDVEGAIYVPAACAHGHQKCDLHVSFHGCGMDKATIGSVYVKNVGLLEYAEQSNIIMLFPQTGGATTIFNASKSASPTVQHCWDNYGITGPDYALRDGREMAAVARIVRHVADINF